MKTIVITGGSRGIGAATALIAAQRGYAVAINYHKSKSSAEALVDRITATHGVAKAFQADVSKPAAVKKLMQDVYQAFGSIDVLVNNAGILERQSRLENISAARMKRMLNMNFMSAFYCCQEVIPYLSTKNGHTGGVIVNVSSIAARTGAPFEYIDYAASKGALEALTVGLSKELAEEGIRVNGVRPAFIKTDIHASGGEPNRIARIQPTIPLHRGGEPEEVAEAILWLASEQSSYSTGIFIDVTGGK